MSFKDGVGNERQAIQMESGDAVILDATLYDNLGRGAITLQSAPDYDGEQREVIPLAITKVT